MAPPHEIRRQVQQKIPGAAPPKFPENACISIDSVLPVTKNPSIHLLWYPNPIL
jgi:hypothetical protein